ncbi:MAG: metallophosphoesterase family protein [Odoribacteraceae bacterium]|jgi:predicted phosphodiesterase|nr:metallophosphoesterase family protein [Odoribacteraceae bacterium]
MKTRGLFFVIALLARTALFAQANFSIQYGPYLQNIGEEEVTVVWVTSGDALGWVEVAPGDRTHFYAEERPRFFETSNGRRLIGRLHRVTIPGLQKGTTYRYRVYAREVVDGSRGDVRYGKSVATNPYRTFRFTTLDSSKEGVHFAVVNDIHGRNDVLESLLKNVEIDDLDFMVFNGDMMSQLDSEELMFNGFLNKSVELFASNLPFFFTRGNHETRGPFSTRFMDYFPTSTGLPYYTFRHGPAYFIMLDSGEDKPDSDIEYGGLAAFDEYRCKQAEWLKEIVSSREFRESPVKIVAIHVPAFTSTWHGTLHVQELFIPILNGTGIDLMFCGHTHTHSYLPKGERENDFPILTNSNNEILDIVVKGEQIKVKISDHQGKVTKTIDL